MSDVLKICAFHSQGQSFFRILEVLRQQYSDADITAMVPAGYPVSEEERSLVNNVFEMELPEYSPRDVGPCIRLVRDIRKRRFDKFIVMFPSPQLQIMAALSGARDADYLMVDGRSFELFTSIFKVLFKLTSAVIKGHLRYLAIWANVRFCPVRVRQSRRRQ